MGIEEVRAILIAILYAAKHRGDGKVTNRDLDMQTSRAEASVILEHVFDVARRSR